MKEKKKAYCLGSTKHHRFGFDLDFKYGEVN